MSYKILVAEDDENIIDVCVRYLEREDFQVITANDGHEAVTKWREQKPDLIILDIMMPHMDGLEAAEEIRFHDDVPIVFLTALGQEKDRLNGLSLGVDDYLTKPFSPRELVLRVKNILRRTYRSTLQNTKQVSFGEVTVDYNNRTVKKMGDVIEVTVKEFELLWFLVSNPSQVFSRSQLLEKIWGFDYSGDTNTVNVHIRRLREKVESEPSNPKWLKTVWGIGYKFEERKSNEA
ncbi:response regulator transcription factor [Bacillus solimangrovi]|uniref:DNA-binding response regulator n=1 Tax=Bacillus solimangrovi TaxID=1305675 RepID=A0A1E5LFB8_9BACI|nr:response regulator transcription factor [Bacillus solimangrovi]OEH92771.1 DNA-binding response regulator [Bacillus solimangrovi]